MRYSTLAMGGAVAIAALAAGVGRAQAPGAADAQACVAETDDARRLACYDRALKRTPPAAPTPVAVTPAVAASVAVAPAAPTPVVAAPAAEPVAAAAARPAPAPGPAAAPAEQSFGLPPPPPAPKPRVTMTAEVVAVSLLPQGVPLIRLANQQEWVGVESGSAEFPLKAGDSVTVRPGVFGGFLLTGSESGQRSIRVRRLR